MVSGVVSPLPPYCYSKTNDEKMVTYKDMANFSSDDKNLKTYIYDDLKVKSVPSFDFTCHMMIAAILFSLV